MKTNLLIFILFLIWKIPFAQHQDFPKGNFVGVKSLEVRHFNGCAKKGFRTKYYFNGNGQIISAKHLFKREKRLTEEFQYDSLGYLKYQISTFNINKEGQDTISFNYLFDFRDRISQRITKTQSGRKYTEVFSDFNELDKPRKILSFLPGNTDPIHKIVEYNKFGLVTKRKLFENDSTSIIEILDYNESGDLCYSLIPSIIGKEKEPLAIWVGGGRFAPEERYEYVYDEFQRWKKKYVRFRDKRILIESRVYQ